MLPMFSQNLCVPYKIEAYETVAETDQEPKEWNLMVHFAKIETSS